MIKGEADGTTVIMMQINREKGSMRPIFWVAERGPELTDVPRLEELPLSAETRSFIKAVTTPLTVARTYLAPPGTPKGPLRIVQKAFEKTVKSKEFGSAVNKLNLPARYLSSEKTREANLRVLKTPPQAVSTLKRIMGISKSSRNA